VSTARRQADFAAFERAVLEACEAAPDAESGVAPSRNYGHIEIWPGVHGQ